MKKTAADHFIGYKLFGVVGDESDWSLQFDQNTVMKNHDEERTDPPHDVEGLSLLSVDYNEDDTTLNFGSLNPDQTPNIAASVVFTPTLYSISQPGSETIFPQVWEEVEIPSDPSDERVADGPDEVEEEE